MSEFVTLRDSLLEDRGAAARRRDERGTPGSRGTVATQRGLQARIASFAPAQALVSVEIVMFGDLRYCFLPHSRVNVHRNAAVFSNWCRELEVRNRTWGNRGANFGFAALANRVF
jgi:hypothetical protein